MRKANREAGNAAVEAEALKIGEQISEVEQAHATLPQKKKELGQAEEDLLFISGLENQDDESVREALAHFSGEQTRLTGEIKKITKEYDDGLADWRTEVPDLKEKALDKLREDLPKYDKLFEDGKHLEIRDIFRYLSGQKAELLKHDEHDEYTDQLDINIEILNRLFQTLLTNMDVGLRFGEKDTVKEAIKCWKQFDGVYYVDPDIEEKVGKGGMVEISNHVTRQDFEKLREGCSPEWQKIFDGIPQLWEKLSKLKNQLDQAEKSGDSARSEKIKEQIAQTQEELKTMVREIVQLATVAEFYKLDKPGHAGDKRVARILLRFFHDDNLETDTWSADFTKLVREEFDVYGENLQAEAKESSDVLKAKMTLTPEMADEVASKMYVRLTPEAVSTQNPDVLLKYFGGQVETRGYMSDDRVPTQIEAEISRLDQVGRILSEYLSEYAGMRTQAQKLETAAKGLFKGNGKDALHAFYVKAVQKLNGNLLVRGGEVVSVGNYKEYPAAFARLVAQREKEAKKRLEKLEAAEKKLKEIDRVIKDRLRDKQYKAYHDNQADLAGYQSFAERIQK